jgi:prepilin-type N-terminal cleavage/methylation domain-containing protein
MAKSSRAGFNPPLVFRRFAPPLAGPSKTDKTSGGFTLVEVLLALALAGIVAVALYGNLAAAVRIWRVLQGELPDEEKVLFFEKAGVDFHHVIRFEDLPFEGDGESVRFPAIVTLEPELGGDRGIGEVCYFYDPRERAILKEVRSLSDVFRERGGRRELLQRNVHRLRLSYFMREEGQFGAYQWVDEWKSEDAEGALPIAVRMDYESREPDGTRSYSRTFLIPVGGAARAS